MSRKNRLFINDTDSCVDEMLEGLVMSNPSVRLVKGHRVVVREDISTIQKRGEVTLICGGGSGHEPFAAGFVGQGMLSAAVAGMVFASPPPNDILAALKAVQSPGGTLVIVANYTGDRLNFGMAQERAKLLGIKTSMVVVAEDTALTSSDKTAGRRGLVGIVNVMKIAGALAEQGRSLEEVTAITQEAANNMGTIGVSLSACSVPGTGGPSFQLPETEMELGLGAHGEAGVKRMRLLPANETVEVMIDHMLDEDNNSRLRIDDGDHVSVTMNNLGGLSELEMLLLSKRAIEYLQKKGALIDFFYMGHFMTSLDMAGFNMNVTKLNLVTSNCMQAHTSVTQWNHFSRSLPDSRLKVQYLTLSDELTSEITEESRDVIPENFVEALIAACNMLMSSESQLNDLDTTGGDGDCGSTLKRGAIEVLSKIDLISKSSLSNVFHIIASCAEQSMGGASGGLYSLLFTAASQEIKDGSKPEYWLGALKSGMCAMSKYGGANVGDRTMLDSLHAVVVSLEESITRNDKNALANAARASSKAAESTINMKAQAGRASYVASNVLMQPDPGAVAVSLWMNSITNSKQG